MSLNAFELANIPAGETVPCERCSLKLEHRAWVRPNPERPDELQAVCLHCAEALEAEDTADGCSS